MSVNDIKAVEASLSKQLASELSQLRTLQADAAKKRADALEAKIEERSRTQLDLLQAFITAQTDAERKRDERWQSTVKFVIAPLIAALIGGGGVGAKYVHDRVAASDPRAVMQESADAVRAALGQRVEEVDAKMRSQDARILRIAEIMLDHQVAHVETTNYLVDKIDVAFPRAKHVAPPQAFKRAQEDAARIKAAGGRRGYDPAHPFADLEAP